MKRCAPLAVLSGEFGKVSIVVMEFSLAVFPLEPGMSPLSASFGVFGKVWI